MSPAFSSFCRYHEDVMGAGEGRESPKRSMMTSYYTCRNYGSIESKKSSRTGDLMRGEVRISLRRYSEMIGAWHVAECMTYFRLRTRSIVQSVVVCFGGKCRSALFSDGRSIKWTHHFHPINTNASAVSLTIPPKSCRHS